MDFVVVQIGTMTVRNNIGTNFIKNTHHSVEKKLSTEKQTVQL